MTQAPDPGALPWRRTAEGLTLSLRVTPRGGRDAIDGVEAQSDGRPVLRVRVRVAAEDGAANKAVIALIAKSLGASRSDVRLLSGATARLKQVAVDGDPAALTARLEALVAG
jgi:uncharacterized protein (TIGR00251 family)